VVSIVGREILYNEYGQSEGDPCYDWTEDELIWDFTLEPDKLKLLQSKIHFATEEEDHWCNEAIPWLENYPWLVDELNAFADHFLAKPCVERIVFSIESSPDSCGLEPRLMVEVKKEYWLKYCRMEDSKYGSGKVINFEDRQKLMEKVMGWKEAEQFITNDLETPGLWYIWPMVEDYYG
jgi:hypothetical protein